MASYTRSVPATSIPRPALTLLLAELRDLREQLRVVGLVPQRARGIDEEALARLECRRELRPEHALERALAMPVAVEALFEVEFHAPVGDAHVRGTLKLE
jgi:hypothetical protein